MIFPLTPSKKQPSSPFSSRFTANPLSLHSELYTLLLEDILVLLQKQDERLILKCHSKNLAGTGDTKHIFSPIIKLGTVLVRSVATGQLTANLFFLLCFLTKGSDQQHHKRQALMHVEQNGS